MDIDQSTLLEARKMLREYLGTDLYRIDRPIEYTVDWLTPRIENTFRPGGKLIDLGGGYSVVNAVLSQLGMKVYTVDLMASYRPYASQATDGRDDRLLLREKWLKDKGVNHIHHDLLTYDFSDFSENSVDVICSYHCFEHLHHGPKSFAQHIKPTLLSHGGTLFVELPNSVNLLKRLKVLAGITNYGKYDEYFNSKQFYGHVREYSIGDLRYFAQHIGFSDYAIFGRNHFGTLYGKFGYGMTPKLIDYILRLRPGLCSSIYLKAVKE